MLIVLWDQWVPLAGSHGGEEVMWADHHIFLVAGSRFLGLLVLVESVCSLGAILHFLPEFGFGFGRRVRLLRYTPPFSWHDRLAKFGGVRRSGWARHSIQP